MESNSRDRSDEVGEHAGRFGRAGRSGGEEGDCARAGRLAVDAVRRASGTRARRLAVHTRAVTFGVDSGEIVTLLPGHTPIHPWAIQIPDFATARTQIPESGVLAVRSANDDEWSLDIGAARLVSGRVRVLELRLARRPNRDVSPATIAPIERTVSEWLDSVKESRPVNPAREILRGVREGGDVSALADFLGRGEGLTPSGDDILLGTLAALDLRSNEISKEASRDREREVSNEASRARERLVNSLPARLDEFTPRLSAQMLRAAVEGRYPEPLLALAEAIADAASQPAAVESAVAESAAVRSAVESVLRLGHDSGVCMVLGFLLGLRRASEERTK